MTSGIRSSWWRSGCNNSTRLLLRCQPRRNPCSPIPTLSSVVSKRPSTMLLRIFLRISIPDSRLGSSKLIQSSDNIIIGLISPLTIFGLLVREFPTTYHRISEFNHPVLDPRISYDGLKEDFDESGDLQLLNDLNKAKQELFKFYEEHYAHRSSQDNTLQRGTTATSSGSSIPPTSSFTARYQRRGPQILNQLEDYFRLSREPDFDGCDPLEWWRSHRKRWPQLYRLACDILAIPGVLKCHSECSSPDLVFPGSAVAVERIFSGGRDTISLRRASLQPETVRTLMLVKHCLWLKRNSNIISID